MNIIKQIKEGGQKKVFLVEKDGIHMILKTGVFKSANSLRRITREVEILQSIDSKFFPKNYDFQYNEKDGSFLILEEYIEGKTLLEKMNDYNTEAEISEFILNVIEGMKLLWDREIVHRDLKPENIMISNATNKPVIIDLGIARNLLAEDLTNTIGIIGPCTIPYASPEQLQNQKNLISPRSDFFSLGIIAMELYYKNNPFEPKWVGNGLSIQENIILGNKRIEVKENSDSERFLRIFSKTLETIPHNRYRKYSNFESELVKFLRGDDLHE